LDRPELGEGDGKEKGKQKSRELKCGIHVTDGNFEFFTVDKDEEEEGSEENKEEQDLKVVIDSDSTEVSEGMPFFLIDEERRGEKTMVKKFLCLRRYQVEAEGEVRIWGERKFGETRRGGRGTNRRGHKERTGRRRYRRGNVGRGRRAESTNM
jgi:hypothetical protein